MAQASRTGRGIGVILSLCIASAGVIKSLSVGAFMLAWTHSVEKVEWQEDWAVTDQGLQITQARVKGSGAGMEPSPDAKLVEGWYRWTPQLKALPEVVLGNSGVAGEWRICTNGSCQDLSVILGRPIGNNVTTLSVCKGDEASALDAKALNERASAWRAKGDRRRALADLDAALKLKPDFEAARTQRKELFHEIELLGAKMPLKQNK